MAVTVNRDDDLADVIIRIFDVTTHVYGIRRESENELSFQIRDYSGADILKHAGFEVMSCVALFGSRSMFEYRFVLPLARVEEMIFVLTVAEVCVEIESTNA